MSVDNAAARLRRLLLNVLSLLLAYILPRILTIGAVILAARMLGTSGFGEYGTAAAFAVLLSIVATLGMQPLLIREMAREPDSAGEWLRAAHIVKVVTCALMMVMLILLARRAMGYPAEVTQAAALLGVAYAVGAFAENLAAWFQSIERMEVWMQASAWYGLVTGAVGAVLVATTRSVVWFCVAPVAGQLASVAWLAYRAPPGMRLGPVTSGSAIRRLLAGLLPFAAGFIALTAHSKVDVLILAGLWPSDEVGNYTAAHKFIDIVQALAVVGAAAVYPRLSRAAYGTERQASSRLLEITLIAAIVAAGALHIGRSFAVSTLFGADYIDAVRVTGILAIAIAPLAFNIVGGYVLAAAGRMRAVATLYAITLVLKLALNVLLVPGGGAVATAIALTASEITLAIAMAFTLHHAIGAAPAARAAVGTGLVAAVWVAIEQVPDATGGIAAAIAFVVTAILTCLASGVIPRSERALLAAALRGATGDRA